MSLAYVITFIKANDITSTLMLEFLWREFSIQVMLWFAALWRTQCVTACIVFKVIPQMIVVLGLWVNQALKLWYGCAQAIEKSICVNAGFNKDGL